MSTLMLDVRTRDVSYEGPHSLFRFILPLINAGKNTAI